MSSTPFESRVLMIGAIERDAGKTTLSERVLTHFLRSGLALSAVKVTVFRGHDTDWGFKVWEEENRSRDKDTGRLLRAGASRVLWLKCDEAHLQEGVGTVMKRLPEGPLLVESNSARKVIRPGVFLMVKPRKNSGAMKPSAEAVLERVDHFITSEIEESGLVYQPNPIQHLYFDGGAWQWR